MDEQLEALAAALKRPDNPGRIKGALSPHAGQQHGAPRPRRV
jgi:hypothetical protein